MVNIYRIRLKNTEDWYVGQTIHHPEVRLYQHYQDRKKIPACGIALLMREHPFTQFEVELLETCSSEESRVREQYWIDKCGKLNIQNAVKNPKYDSNYSKEYRRTHPRKNRVDGVKQYEKARNKLLEKTLCPYCLTEIAECSVRRHINRYHPEDSESV